MLCSVLLLAAACWHTILYFLYVISIIPIIHFHQCFVWLKQKG